MANIRAKAKFAKAYIFNPMSRPWYSEELPELAYSKKEWNLSQEQLNKVFSILTEDLPDRTIDYAWCYHPHHLIVICDENGEILGHVNICLSCCKYRAYPPPLVEANNIKYFREIIHELGMPIYSDISAYGELLEGMSVKSLLFNNHRIEVPESIVSKGS